LQRRTGECCSAWRPLYLPGPPDPIVQYRDVFGIELGPPLHDPVAVAAALLGAGEHEIPFFDVDRRLRIDSQNLERYKVTVVTEGSQEEAMSGAQTGRTIVKLLPPGQEGVRIPRGLDIDRFWFELEACCQRADEANSRLAGR
jgi:uridine nucleosidase